MGLTIDNVLEILEKHKLHIPSNVFYELKADVVNFEMPITKNDLGVDCISREQALKCFTICNTKVDVWREIKALPSVTPQEPKTGKWISTETKGVRYAFWCRYKCSLCGGLSDRTNFCPNCGARMVEPQESKENKNIN